MPPLDAIAWLFMSTTEKEASQKVKDGELHSDGAKKKEKTGYAQAIEYAKAVESCVWLHTLYGGLDGLSVSYSTVKWMCEVYSPSNKEYHENLDHILSDIDFWLPIVLLTTLFISGASLFGIRATKSEDSKLSATEKFLRDWWPYARDLLKGLKNGYKGIKTVTSVLVALDLLDGKNFRNFLLPVGMAFAVVEAANRLYFLSKKDERKKLLNDSKDLAKKIEKCNEKQMELQLIVAQLQSLEYELVKKPLDEHTINKDRQNLQEKANAKKAELDKLLGKNTIDSLLKEQELAQQKLKEFNKNNKNSLLISKAIGGLVDGPYLYLGITTLAKLNTTLLSVVSLNFMFFWCACIATRIYEEYEEQKKSQFILTQSTLEQLITRFNELQYQLICANTEQFLGFKSSQPSLRGEELFQAYRAKSADTFNEQYKELEELLIEVDSTMSTLKALKTPTYTSAIMNGLKDGLSAYGALSCTYFVVGIYCALYAQAFPVFLVGASVAFGLAAIAGFVGLRLYQTHQDLKNPGDYFSKWKEMMEFELKADRENTLLSPINCNTDGLTKGEFYFQSIFEVVRSLTNGPYKSQNLSDFFYTAYEHDDTKHDSMSSSFMFLFWGGLSIIYGLCLAIRAFGKEFYKKPVPSDSIEEKSKPGMVDRKETVYKSSSCTFFGRSPEPPVPSPALSEPEPASSNRFCGLF